MTPRKNGGRRPRRPRPPMTPRELRRLGEATYGFGWQTALALDLSIARNTVTRWAMGTRGIQAYFARQVRECCNWRILEQRETVRSILKDQRRLRAPLAAPSDQTSATPLPGEDF